MKRSATRLSLLFAVAGLLTAQEKITEIEHNPAPVSVSERGTLTPLDGHSPRQFDAGDVQFVIRQHSAAGIRLAAITSGKDHDRRVVRNAFEDKTNAQPHQATGEAPILGMFEDRRDNISGMRLIPIRVVRYGEHSYKVIPQHKLAPGEYIVNTADGEFRFTIRAPEAAEMLGSR
jgi:hypothetical protein